MGHERLGALPRTKPWREVVRAIGATSDGDVRVEEVAKATIVNVRSRLQRIREDAGVRAVLQFLVALSVASREHEPNQFQPWGIELPSRPTPIALGALLRQWTKTTSGTSGEYSEIATQAATDSFAQWRNRHVSLQSDLFEERPHPYSVWRPLGRGDGFSELSHLFFSNFTRRYLNYFLEREASAELATIADRENFDIDVRRHALETARIAQSLAAGWYNKHALRGLPSKTQVNRLLDYSLSKIQEELLREGDAR